MNRSLMFVCILLLVFTCNFSAFSQTELTHLSHLTSAWTFAEDIQVQDNYAFVAGGISGLHVLDISDGNNLEEVSCAYSGDMMRYVCLLDNYAYTVGNRISAFDISDISNPELLSSQELDSYALSLDASGDVLAFSLYPYNGVEPLRIYDISDRGNPVLSASLDIPAQYVMVHDDMVFLVRDDHFFVSLDVSDPTEPHIINTLNLNYSLRECIVVDNYIFIAAAEDFVVIDMTNPSSIFELTSIPLTESILPHEIDCHGECVYLSGFGSIVINVSDPTDPVITSQQPANWDANNMICTENLMFLTDNYNGVYVYDISNVLNFSEISQYNRIGNSTRSIIHGDLLITNGKAANTLSWSDLQIYSITDPANPVLLSNMQLGENRHSGTVYSIRAVDDVLYLAGNINSQNGFFSIDISDPSNPSIMDFESSGRWMEGGMQISGDRAYVNCDVSGMKIYDISDPTNLTYLGRDDNGPEYANEFGLYEDYALIYNGSLLYYHIRILDISDPTNVSQVAVYEDTLGPPSDFDFADGIAFVASYNSPLKLIDMNDPLNPELLTVYENLYAANICVSDTLAWVADVNSDLYLLDISDIYQPEILSTIHLDGLPIDMEIDAETGLVVINNSWYVDILQVTQTDVKNEEYSLVPQSFNVSQAWPNPFNSSTRFNITLPQPGKVDMAVYDILGRMLYSSSNQYSAGESRIIFDTQNLKSELSTGIYFLRLGYENNFRTQKITYLK